VGARFELHLAIDFDPTPTKLDLYQGPTGLSDVEKFSLQMDYQKKLQLLFTPDSLNTDPTRDVPEDLGISKLFGDEDYMTNDEG
jgi:hypothetical protein